MDLVTLATSVTPDSSTGFTLTVVIAGLGIVLATLAVLIIVFRLFGLTVEKSQKAAKKKSAKKLKEKMEADLQKSQETPVASAKNAPAPSPKPQVEDGISEEVVAAISAAVYTLEGSNATVRSITKKKSPISARNPWAQAAIIDNTRSF